MAREVSVARKGYNIEDVHIGTLGDARQVVCVLGA
jgi:hypothetical protein